MTQPTIIDEYTLTAVPLTLLCKESEIGVATGFFYMCDGYIYLVSNWHVMSGRNTYTGQAVRPDAALPDKLLVQVHGDFSKNETREFKLKLCQDDETPIWRQHRRGQDIDVAVLRCGKALPGKCVAHTLPMKSDIPDMALKIGMETFVLGFPKGITSNKIFPVWKRASVATEPAIDHNGLPLFLVDTATRDGMSGAPVLLRTSGGYQTESNNRNVVVGVSTKFIGVYSGRHNAADEFGAQLGRVWRRTVIDEIIARGVVGSYDLRT